MQAFASHWLTLAGASLFVYCSVLTLQGSAALLLPRWLFLRFSGILQVVVFGILLGTYFLQEPITTSSAMALPENHRGLSWWPGFWFFALFNQLNGSLPANLTWLAQRAWIGLAVVVSGAVASLLFSYLHTMRKTVEEPDLVKRRRGAHWAPRFGSGLHTAIVLFSIRSLMRSRQHRLAFSFYLAVILSIAFYWFRIQLSIAGRSQLNSAFLLATFMMTSLAVFGLRSVFSLPISLTANWALRTTQLYPSEQYIAATRRVLLLFAVAPVWILSALLSVSFKPLPQVAAHLAVLALIGWIFAELALIGFYKVPFTCSYLPGKVHIQIVLGGSMTVLFALALTSADYELPALRDPLKCALMIAVLASLAAGLWVFNRHRAQAAVLYFEELPPDMITTLGISSIRPW